MSIKMPSVLHDHIRLKGGWDQNTPSLELLPGVVRDAINFEANVTGGYTRIAGYERFDGREKPSDASITFIHFGSVIHSPAYGEVLTDTTSGASATVIASVSSGAQVIVVVIKRTGSFAAGDNIQVGASVVGAVAVPSVSLSASQYAQYTASAADYYRSSITAVPGSGAALGYVLYQDIVYAFRANAGGTAVDLYKSSATGWVNVPYFYEVYFTAASVAPAEGATLTKGAVTATVKRVVLQSGAYAGGTAAGKMIITAPAGGNFSAGAFTGGMTGTCAGIQTAITFAVGGKFEFDQGNLAGGTATNRVYGCDGVNRCFEFDGTVLVPIDTGLGALDKPKHIAVHKSYLIVSVASSLMFSVAGRPYCWDATLFAGEIGIGEDITGLKPLPGSSATAALLVTSRNNTSILYGTGYSTWNLVTYNSGSGALDYTLQNMADTYMMDDRGVAALKASLNYGNFDTSTLTFNINKFIEAHRANVTYATLDRRKSQYRIFFSDGFGLYITVVNGVMMGAMPVWYPTPVYMCDEGKYSTGAEASFFCGTDGFIYQLDKGTSFDGAAINAFFTLKYHSASSPRDLKRYRKAAVEVTGDGYCMLGFGYSLGYGKSEISQSNSSSYANNFALTKWDNFTWDAFSWDGSNVIPNECEMNGTAENVAITISSGTPYYKPFTVNSILVHHTARRAMR